MRGRVGPSKEGRLRLEEGLDLGDVSHLVRARARARAMLRVRAKSDA